MKKLKRVIVSIISMTLILTNITTVYGKEIDKEVEIAGELGILKGSTGKITEDYLQQPTTRLQAAIVFLRLKGLEEQAKQFSGEKTFSDAKQVHWIGGRNILAYLKENGELGWIGNNNQFNPNKTISAKEYYKVLLETLGYEIGKDYMWDNVLSFAKEKGLSKISNVKELTNKDIAVATVEALELKTKEGVVLINLLVESNIIDPIKADRTGLYKISPKGNMISATSIDATTILVEFDEAIEPIDKDFKLNGLDSKEYDIKSIEVLKSEKSILIKTEELTLGSIYTISYRDKSLDIVPIMKKQEIKPQIESATAITGEVVRLVFNSRNIRKDSLVPSNFEINNIVDNDVVVTNVRFDEFEMKKNANYSKTIVLLDVTGIDSGLVYTVKPSNITSYTGAVNDNTKQSTFAGISTDTKAPKLKSAISKDGYGIDVVFEEDMFLDETTALDLNNYKITPELNILSAKIEKNELNDDNIVRLTTTNQKDIIYTIEVNNISDGKNIMVKSEDTVVAGIVKPDNQVAKAVNSLTSTTIEVIYNCEANSTALDISNYSINNGLMVVDAEFKINELNKKVDYSRVILTTTPMKSTSIYEITIDKNVQDILNQGLKETTHLVFAGISGDQVFDKNILALAIDTYTVKIIFNEEVNKELATDIRNYNIKELGYPAKAILNDDNKTVTLIIPEQKARVYKLIINNITDISGNMIEANTEVIFGGIAKQE
ncbi:hypothetical protein [Vallitalea guaymasensis]|uniref:X-Prolyl dipeptidyl aminopeptidase PepX N-terminal domain-containing protein n=1 Tax=Vallitalea guaymasensis TaxID=1185412 RepID=A0A8J8SBV1_9FIRM|nr:hypothetical protein [Vallitalea guaymasensis]QUH29153.1 hypothetical protein HYG85_09540 [Vallitalea guaymasensis]